MPELYARHDLLLSVSEYEGLPLTVMEAAAQGLYPLLSHTRSGHPQLVESLGQGRLCGVGDCRGFAEALLELTADVKTLRRQRAVIQKRASASFDLGRMIRAYADLLMEAVARPKGGMGARTPIELVRPRVDPFRSFVRRWQYARHYGWRSGKSVV